MNKNETVLDVVEIVAKTALSVIPVGGALITAVYDTVKGNALAKRQEKWRCLLEERLSKMEGTLEDLGDNELFATALVRTTELAMKTAREEKMAYLANAVVNSLLSDMEEERMVIFLELLDKYTVSHIKTIYFFNWPERFEAVSAGKYMMGSPKTVLFDVYPELNNSIFKKIYKDLFVDGMVNTDSLDTTMSGFGMIQKRTTELGDEFLKFIINSDEVI